MTGSFEKKVVSLALGLVTAALFTFLVVYGTNVFVPHPDFNKSRNECYKLYVPVYREGPYYKETSPPDPKREERLTACLDEVENAEKQFHRKQVMIALPLGIVAIALGILRLRSSFPAGTGFVLGGLATTVFALITAADALSGTLIFYLVLAVLLMVLCLSRLFMNLYKGKNSS